MPYFGQEHFIRAEEKGPLTDDEYKEALEKCHKYSQEEGIDLAIKDNDLDAIVAPTGGPAWPMDYVNGDHFTGGSSSLAAVSGYANITVPAGYVFGLPVGISFFSGAFQEPALLKIAYAFEQLEKIREQPKYLEEFNITYPNAPDLRSTISSKYDITGVPETFFIDKEGKVVHIQLGPVNETMLTGLIDQMLAAEVQG